MQQGKSDIQLFTSLAINRTRRIINDQRRNHRDGEDHLADPKTVGRIRLCIKGFDDGETFLKASNGDIMKSYNEQRPGGVRGCGKVFWKMLDVIRANAKFEAHKAHERDSVSPVANVSAVTTAAPQQPVFYSAEFFKAVSTIMELGNIKEIDGAGIQFLHEHFKVNEQPADKPVAEGEAA